MEPLKTLKKHKKCPKNCFFSCYNLISMKMCLNEISFLTVNQEYLPFNKDFLKFDTFAGQVARVSTWVLTGTLIKTED